MLFDEFGSICCLMTFVHLTEHVLVCVIKPECVLYAVRLAR